MPNHVMNEIVFRGVDAARRAEIMANAINDKGDVDFEILLPAPINIWPGSVGTIHEKTFPGTHLDWARLNWGTKWNAYSQKPIEQTDNELIFRFETAWRPPYGWLVAMFNRFKISFEHNWLSEGHDRGVCAKWDYAAIDDRISRPAWEELPADDTMQRHLHKLLWGVEEFPAEPDEAVA